MRDQAEIARRCLEVEQRGGDVLEYLKGCGHISPRATWIRLQLNELGRKENRLTDGRPGKEKEMEEKQTRTGLTREEKMAAVQAVLDGGSYTPYLRSAGIANPTSCWYNIRKWLAKHDPETLAKLPKNLKQREDGGTVLGRPMADFEPMPEAGTAAEAPVMKIDGAIRIETPEAKKVQVVEVPEDGGLRKAAEIARKSAEQEKPAEARITRPLMHSGKTAIGWEGDFGNYIYDRKHGYIDYESSDGEEISMPVDAWREWLKEIREVAQLMGVMV